MSSLMNDLGAYLPSDVTQTVTAKHSTNTKAGKELDMMDYLMLMVASLQNQTIDDTMSTSEMMNQMSTMSMMQAITSLNETLSETSTMTYAASLIGQDVTVAIGYGSDAMEFTGKVTGVSVLNGEVVIFMGNNMFYLSDIVAIGRLPSAEEVTSPETGNGEDGEDDGDIEGSEGSGDSGSGSGSVGDGEDQPEGVSIDGGTGTYYGYSYNANDFEYIQDANGAIRIVYKGEDGASGGGYTEQMVPGGATGSVPGVAAVSEAETQRNLTQEQSSAGAEVAAAQRLAEENA